MSSSENAFKHILLLLFSFFCYMVTIIVKRIVPSVEESDESDVI